MGLQQNRFDDWCDWFKAKKSLICLGRHGIFSNDVESLLRSRGVDVWTFNVNDDDIAHMKAAIEEHGSAERALVLTINFYPPLALKAEQLGMSYGAWIVDCTLNVFVHDAKYARPNVHLMLFDERDVDRFSRAGFPDILYLPLSANDERMRRHELSAEEKNLYGADVSFVGDAMIRDCNEYRNQFLPLLDKMTVEEPDPLARRLLRMTKLSCEEVLGWFDLNMFSLVDDISNRLREKESEYRTQLVKLGVSDFEHLAFMVAKEASSRLRRAVVQNLADTGIDIWGAEDWREVVSGKNRYRGTAEHLTVLPKIYNASKINLNITRTYSDRGAPMRVFDIPACGGFLLTNHSHTVEKYFRPGKDVETYESLDELKEKIRYYLEHEQRRLDVAESGYQACRTFHTHKHRLSALFSRIFPDAPPANPAS